MASGLPAVALLLPEMSDERDEIASAWSKIVIKHIILKCFCVRV